MNKTTELNFLGLPKRTWWCCELKQVHSYSKEGGKYELDSAGDNKNTFTILWNKLLEAHKQNGIPKIELLGLKKST